MALAERNWKFNLETGNLGVTGNFFQKVTPISANHSYEPGDGLLCVDTTSAPITITLPPIASWPLQDYRIIIPIMHTGGLNNVLLKLSGEETFLLGNTQFDLGPSVSAFDFYVINSESLTTYGILSDLTIQAVSLLTSAWASTAWAALAIVPFESELDNTGPELLVSQTYIFGAIASSADGGDGTVVFADGAHGLSIGDIITIVSTTNYNNDYEIVAVPDEDHFSIEETFLGDETGTWKRPARYTLLTAGMYKVAFSAQIDSTGGATWSAVASVYANGILVDNTTVTVSGAIGENKSMNLQPYEYYFDAGTVLDVRIDHTTLTGNLTGCLFQVEMKAL